MADIPSVTTFDNLLAAIKTKLEAITTVHEVIVGTYGSVARTQKESGEFPYIEILYNEQSGEGCIDQRIIRANYLFELRGFTYVENSDRITGTDMKAIESLGVAMRQQMYSFHDDETDPCDGFRMVNGDFNLKVFYQEFDEHQNTAVLIIGFKVDTYDITA